MFFTCETNHDCTPDYCLDGKCAPAKVEEGGACQFPQKCEEGFVCALGICSPTNLENGELCKSHKQCKSDLCAGECLEVGIEKGGSCYSNYQCKTGFCSKNGCASCSINIDCGLEKICSDGICVLD